MGNTPAAIKILFPWQLTLFQSPPTLFQYVSDFQLEKRWTGPQTGANIFIRLLDHTYEAPFANMKIERWRWPEMPLILGRSGTQYVAMVTKLRSSYCVAPLVEPYCKESNISVTNWLRYLFSSYLSKNLVEYMTSSLGWFAYFKNLNISGTKRDIWKKWTAFFFSYKLLVYALKWLQ